MEKLWIVRRCVLFGAVAFGVLLSLGGNYAPSSIQQLIESARALQKEQPQEKSNAPATAQGSQSVQVPASSTADGSAWGEGGRGNDDETLTPETLVSDWEKPDFTLFVTGRQHGYIEPCGCITLERQKGGLMRRHRVMKTLASRGWDLVPLDAGNQVRRFGQQPELKIASTYEGLCKEMKYDLIGLGPDDLKLPATDFVQTMINMVDQNNPFTCANVEVVDPSLTNKFQVINRGGKKIGVTMVLGQEHLVKLQANTDLKLENPTQALRRVVPQLQAQKCDFHVLIAFSSLDNCRELAKAFPVFDLMVTAGGAGDPTLEPEVVESASHMTPMIQVGVKGMYVGLVGVYQSNGSTKIKYKRVPLTHKFKDTEEMKRIFLSYQNKLKSLWLAGALTDIVPRNHPTGHAFVGSDACADCHAVEYEIWIDGVDGDGGPHAEATDSLKQNPNDDRVWVQRHFDPECMSCHATGWNPQNFYPYKTGLTDLKKHEHLFGNGCENCHGPGSAHSEMESAAAKGNVDQNQLDALRKGMRVTVAEARASACKTCHDLDNSPDFLLEGGFDKYWPKIEHGN